MRFVRPLAVVAVASVLLLAGARSAAARSPVNPYSSFNLSGINYGAMQWDRAQRQGKRVWPYYNTPSRGASRGNAVSVGGVGAGGYGGATVRTAQRRWRR
ncbi:MAG: hypothetical protein RLZZ111_647 [Planctomycetota bacterium]|jgi:hypothetical protein